ARGGIEHSDHSDHDGDGEESRHCRTDVDGRETPADSQDIYVTGRAYRCRGHGDRTRRGLHTFVSGQRISLAAVESGGIFGGLRAVRSALAGRDLDRGYGYFRE